jgi:hypothetical protein
MIYHGERVEKAPKNKAKFQISWDIFGQFVPLGGMR